MSPLFEGLHKGLSSTYHVGCDCHPISLAAKNDKPFHFNKKVFDQAIRYIHKTGRYDSSMLKDGPLRELVTETNRILNKAVDNGIVNNEPPSEMQRKLREDVFVFSSCKTHVQLKEASSLLLSEDGRIKPWQKFNQEMTALNRKYNEDYLQSEYVFATSSAEMAPKWSDFEKGGDRYNLQYRTANDDRVRDSHKTLNGTTLPVSDPFWDSYFPPNGWRCRCTVVQVLKEKYPVDNSAEKMRIADKITVELDSKGRDRNAMFRYNPGKQKIIFPPNHPYYKVKGALSSIIPSVQADIEKRDLPAQRLEIKEWAKKNLLNRSISHGFDQIKQPVTFSVKGIKEYINQPHDNYAIKNRSLKNIYSLVRDGRYVRSDKDKDGKPFMYHYIEINMEEVKSYLVLREDIKRGIVVLYSNVKYLK